LLTLDAVAEAFADIEKTDREGAFRGSSTDEAQRQEIVLWVERLHRVGFVAPFRPLITAARGKADPPGLLKLLEACERFSFLVYRVAGVRPNAGRAWLHRLGHEVFHGRVDLGTAAARVLGAIGWYIKTRAAYDRFFELDPESPRSFYEWGGLRYFLYEHELALSGFRQVRLSWRRLHERQPKTTIEHVLPQTPSDPYWDTFDAEARRIYTHDLGNLCLTEDNSSYGNKPFPAKRGEAGSTARCYATSNLFSERALAQSTAWTPATVLARRAELVAWAKQRWPWSAAEGTDVEAIAEEADAEDGA
ncbi:MAG TPA: HNH endonuclease family protein, partial [Polyangiaceae bacterium]|nr:HNH endonuclease family protein [Polyangiaceae bacterium]